LRVQISNAAYGVLDYIAWPAGMLLVAPIALRHLGASQFGVWMIANAALTIGSIVASGFGDANIRSVAVARGAGDRAAMVRAVRGTMGIHLVLGLAVALAAWMLAPLASARIASANLALQSACSWSLRIAALLVLVRAVETVCVSTQRAFERYGAAVAASVAGRLMALAAAAFAPLANRGVVAVLVAAALFITASLGIQFLQLGRLLSPNSLRPSFDRDATRALLGFGIFTWVQAVSGVVFAQADRLLTGIYFGAAAVAAYALCTQLAQPIYGIAASGLHFLFPYVSSRAKADPLSKVRHSILLAFGANLLMVTLGCGILLLWGSQLLAAWVGPSIAQAGAPVLPLLVWSTAAQGLSITGAYTLLALGQVRWVTFLSLAGGTAMLVAAPFLMRAYGIQGMAIARLLYGPCTLLVYVPLAALLFRTSRPRPNKVAHSVCEEAAR
jgi:O-antigen/teichoic acid export membrane protein